MKYFLVLLRRSERLMACSVSPSTMRSASQLKYEETAPSLLCHANPKAASLQDPAQPDRYTPQNTLNCSITSLPQAAGVDRQLLSGVILQLIVGSVRRGGKWVEGCCWGRFRVTEVGGTSDAQREQGRLRPLSF